MKKYLKDNKKMILMSVVMLMFLTACVSVRDKNGNIIPEMLITLDTDYKSCISEGWFNIFVWPIAQLINVIGVNTDAGIGIIIVTLLLNFGTAAISIKQQVSSQKMQMLQPEMLRIQAKYKGKNDQASKMRMAQETQALYNKHGISPFGSIISMFIQFPIIIAVYQAVMRAFVVCDPVHGKFLGIDLLKTPKDGLFGGDMAVVAVFVLMIIFQFLSMKIPQILQKRMKKNSKVKTKDYANKDTKKAGSGMETYMYFSVVMIAFLSFTWPLGMSFYWLVSAVTRVIQNIVIQKFFIKEL